MATERQNRRDLDAAQQLSQAEQLAKLKAESADIPTSTFEEDLEFVTANRQAAMAVPRNGSGRRVSRKCVTACPSTLSDGFCSQQPRW